MTLSERKAIIESKNPPTQHRQAVRHFMLQSLLDMLRDAEGIV
jgi:phenylalanyl-tRNA synthetase beta subunit